MRLKIRDYKYSEYSHMWFMDCMMFIFEKRVPLMRKAASVV